MGKGLSLEHPHPRALLQGPGMLSAPQESPILLAGTGSSTEGVQVEVVLSF